MLCRFRVLLRCPKCDRVFCVPELAGTSRVWHAECDVETVKTELRDGEYADRCVVAYHQKPNRLEISLAWS